VVYQTASEAKYRNLQDRLALISSVSSDSTKNLKVFKDIVALAPNGFIFKVFNLSAGKVQLEANSNSVSILSGFIDKLKAYPSIDSISIDKIQNDTTNGTIDVGISATFKEGGLNAPAN